MLEAVKRLLRDRREAFRAALIDHLWNESLHGSTCVYSGTYHLRLRNFEIVAGTPDNFTVRLLLDRNKSWDPACERYVLAQARFEGDGFKIFSVEFLSPV
ncbi:MAG: hypothetical protein IH926_12090 [Proteobacteria bacterium]|nr:hypothetical protein [Pseudomonadota bacterium]